jgi:nucleotide-binding universal stress UspA family protein
VIDFSYDEAVRRDTGLRVVHGWSLPPYYLDGPTTDRRRYDEVARWHASALGEALNPWRQKYPSLEVVEEFRTGSPANLLIGASRAASLVVVGRRVRHHPFGAHIGPVTHAVLHHATAPVAVVAHD